MKKLSVLLSVLFALFVTAPAFAATPDQLYLVHTGATGSWDDCGNDAFTKNGNVFTIKYTVPNNLTYVFISKTQKSNKDDWTFQNNSNCYSNSSKELKDGYDSQVWEYGSCSDAFYFYETGTYNITIDFSDSGNLKLTVKLDNGNDESSTPWSNTLWVKGNWDSNWDSWASFSYDSTNNYWKATFTPTGTAFDFGLMDGDGSHNQITWYGGSDLTSLEANGSAGNFTFSGGNGKVTTIAANKEATFILTLTGSKTGTLKVVQETSGPDTPTIDDIYMLPNGATSTSEEWKFSSEDGVTYTYTKASIDGGFKFKLRTPSTDYLDDFTTSGSLATYVSKNTDEYNNWYFAEGTYTNVTFTYNYTNNTLTIDGTKVVTTVPWNGTLHIHYYEKSSSDGDVWADTPDFTRQDDGTWTTTITPVVDAFNFGLQSSTDQWFKCNQGTTMAAGTLYHNAFTKNDGSYDGYISLEAGKTYTVTIQLYSDGTDGSIRFDAVTSTTGDYAFGSKLFISYRNDDDKNAEWTTAEIKFDGYDSADNPTGLNQFVYTFRADSRTIPFFLHNAENPADGTIYDSNLDLETEMLVKCLYEGEDSESTWNNFTGLVAGEKYRVVVKSPKDSEDSNETFIGIFPLNSEMPWGTNPEGIRLHSNFENATWPGTNGVANISDGPKFQYNAATGIWYTDFVLGDPSDFSSNLDKEISELDGKSGYEFCFTDIYGINWYKSPIELPLNQWTPGAMSLLTDNNDLNFYVKQQDGLNVGTTYRLLIRKNQTTGEWEMRLIPAPTFNGSLYIKSDNNSVAVTEMPHAVGVDGKNLPGNIFAYTMKYGNNTTFRLSTSADNFDGNLIYATDGADGVKSCTLTNPYDITNVSTDYPDWAAADANGFITVVVDYDNAILRVYSPSVDMNITRRRIQRITGFSASAYGVDKSKLENIVEGSSEADPVTVDRVNTISVDLDLTNLYFDPNCVLTINGLKVNGSDVDNIADRKFSAAGDKDAAHNRIYHLPYTGKLEIDGQFATPQNYTFVLSYTIDKEGVSVDGETTLTYTPNFQPYFVKPLPMAGDDNNQGNLKVKSVWLGAGDWAAIASHTVNIEGTTGETDSEGNLVYSDFSGNGNLDDAVMGVYPGFKVTVSDDNSHKYNNPASAYYSKYGEGFFLENYKDGQNLDWSSAALCKGSLPVLVSLNYTGTYDPTGWITADDERLDYVIYATYPLYVHKGGICVDSDDAAIPAPAAASTSSAAPAKRVHSGATTENGYSTETNVTRVHSIVASREYKGSFDISENITTGIEGVEAEADANAAPEYYNLQGIRVANPAPGNIYILRQGNTTTKVRL